MRPLPRTLIVSGVAFPALDRATTFSPGLMTPFRYCSRVGVVPVSAGLGTIPVACSPGWSWISVISTAADSGTSVAVIRSLMDWTGLSTWIGCCRRNVSSCPSDGPPWRGEHARYFGAFGEIPAGLRVWAFPYSAVGHEEDSLQGRVGSVHHRFELVG